MSTENLNLIVLCPHCNDPILIDQLNCKIFRHGVLKNNSEQINPHSSKIECDNYVNNDLIYGCGKPFKIIELNNEYKVEICDYI
jgi:hypothetical protein